MMKYMNEREHTESNKNTEGVAIDNLKSISESEITTFFPSNLGTGWGMHYSQRRILN